MRNLQDLVDNFRPRKALAIRLKHSSGALSMAYHDPDMEVWLVYDAFSFNEAVFMSDQQLALVAEGVNN